MAVIDQHSYNQALMPGYKNGYKHESLQQALMPGSLINTMNCHRPNTAINARQYYNTMFVNE